MIEGSRESTLRGELMGGGFDFRNASSFRHDVQHS